MVIQMIKKTPKDLFFFSIVLCSVEECRRRLLEDCMLLTVLVDAESVSPSSSSWVGFFFLGIANNNFNSNIP
jgi:hypothetical protein